MELLWLDGISILNVEEIVWELYLKTKKWKRIVFNGIGNGILLLRGGKNIE